MGMGFWLGWGWHVEAKSRVQLFHQQNSLGSPGPWLITLLPFQRKAWVSLASLPPPVPTAIHMAKNSGLQCTTQCGLAPWCSNPTVFTSVGARMGVSAWVCPVLLGLTFYFRTCLNILHHKILSSKGPVRCVFTRFPYPILRSQQIFVA